MSRTNGKGIKPNELYPTPPALVKALLEKITIPEGATFLEPCFGTGAIYNQVDLPERDKYYAEITQGIDYLTTEFEPVDLIITNPPFSLAKEFLIKSLSEIKPTGVIIYLLRLNYLGSVDRLPFWEEVGYPDKVLVATPRPSFTDGGSDACEYAWFCWGNVNLVDARNGVSGLFWDKPKKVRRKKSVNY